MPTKADVIRSELKKGATVSAAAKKAGAAYSQAHTIAKQLEQEAVREEVGRRLKGRDPKKTTLHDNVRVAEQVQAEHRRAKKTQAAESWGEIPNTRGSKKPKPSPVLKKAKGRNGKAVGKLRTPGLPSDIDVGPCVNCEHDLVVRPHPTGFMLIHVNVSTEEHFAVTQFCNAVPAVLTAND